MADEEESAEPAGEGAPPPRRGLGGWDRPVSHIAGGRRRVAVDGDAEKADASPPPTAEASPAASGTPSDAQPKPDTRAPAEPIDETLGAEQRAFEQSRRRDDVDEGMRAFGVRTSHVTFSGAEAHIHGPVVGRDAFFVQQSSASVIAFRVGAATRAEVEAVWIEPAGYGDVVAAADRRQIVILETRRRWGNTTTATRALAQVATIYEVHVEAPLRTLRPEDLPSEAGLILDGLTALQAAELRESDLERVAEDLAGRNSRLFIVMDATTRVTDPGLKRWSVRMDAPPDARQMVLTHLRRILPDARTDDVEALVSIDTVAPLLAQVTLESYDAHQLKALARDLAEINHGRATLEEATERFGLRSQQSLQAWFDEMTEPQFALVVALATFQGMSFDAISRASSLLESAIAEDSGDHAADGYRKREARRVRLAAARAAVSIARRNTRYGTAETEVATFLDAGYPPRVLDYVWREYDQNRSTLLRWLGTVALDAEGAVRIRAALAIGHLAGHSFDTIRRDILVHWATSGDGDARERVVAALRLPARHPNTAGQVVRLVTEWSDKSSQALRLTAARALGAAVGAVMPDGPDKLLAELAKDAPPNLAIAIGDSVAELLRDADDDRAHQLLAMLDTWSAERSHGRQTAGVLAFLEAASSLWRPRRDAEGSEVWWPLLLAKADARPDQGVEAHPLPAGDREIVARLWSRAIRAPRADRAVHRVLGRWAAVAEPIPEMREALASLIVDVVRAGRGDVQRRRLAALVRHHAKAWRAKDTAAPDMAARLLELLTRMGLST